MPKISNKLMVSMEIFESNVVSNMQFRAILDLYVFWNHSNELYVFVYHHIFPRICGPSLAYYISNLVSVRVAWFGNMHTGYEFFHNDQKWHFPFVVTRFVITRINIRLKVLRVKEPVQFSHFIIVLNRLIWKVDIYALWLCS